MTNYFEKCQKCVPPERKPGCQDHCPYYKEAKERYEADKAKINETKTVKDYINAEINKNKQGVARYIKRRPKNMRRK